jgi:hypothetical protein
MQHIAVIFVLFHKLQDHPFLFLIVFGIYTAFNKLNLFNIKVKLGNYLKYLLPVVLGKFLNPVSDLLNFFLISDVDLAEDVNL